MGITEKAALRKADGLVGIDIVYPCDVTIAGMGGELICSIIDSKPELKSDCVRLILQPMTRQETLRKYLSENGFRFEKEITVEEGKYYTVIACSYDGIKRELSPFELVFGAEGIRTEDETFAGYLKAKLSVIKNVSAGKKTGGSDSSYEDGIIKQAEKMLNERGVCYDA
jgi:tRNA (adenine22-N1)-methyltransferase